MPRIFISYRRADSEIITARIYDRLVSVFGERNIFKDVDDIPIGVDFRAVLHQAVNRADVALIIVGPNWARITYENGQPRLHDPNDFVRIELENALRKPGMVVVPVLVMNAQMPSPEHLPPSIRELSYRNAIAVRNDPDFNSDIKRLVQNLKKSKPTSNTKLLTAVRPNNLGRVLLIGAGLFFVLIVSLAILLAIFLNPPNGLANPTETEAVALITEETRASQAPTATVEVAPPTQAVHVQTQPYLTVVIDSLNLRSGPSTQYNVIAQIAKDTRADILAQNRAGTWVYIRLENNLRGWVSAHSSFVSISGNLLAIAIATDPPTPVVTATFVPTATFYIVPTHYVTWTPSPVPSATLVLIAPPTHTRVP
jgi:hypothetical protein